MSGAGRDNDGPDERNPTIAVNDQCRRVGGALIPAVVAAAAVIAGVSAILLTRSAEQPPVTLPEFPLGDGAPDPNLHGTIAYFSKESGGGRVVAAAGAPVRDVLCIEDTAGGY